MSLQAVIDVARAYLGTTEDPPGSNRTIFGAEYGLDGQPWCVMFLWYCFTHAGERMAFFGGGKTASCSILLRWYKEQGLTVPVEDVHAGDIVLLNFHGGKDPEHCGLVVDVFHMIQPGPDHEGIIDYIRTIEGNTTSKKDGSQDNGGCVAMKQRFEKNIVAVCRPQYQPESSLPKNDYEDRWSQKAIEEAKSDGVLNGYPDGSFKPTNPVTRGELAQFYLNLKERGLLR